MIDTIRLQEIIAQYKTDFVSGHWEQEKYKWEAVKCFQDNWDINASDFADMLGRSLAKTSTFLASANYYPAKMITLFAKAVPEKVRAMFTVLFDESKDIYERIQAFKAESGKILSAHGNGAGQHYQTENAISVYLWLRFPDKYYIYKLKEARKVSSVLNSNSSFKNGAYEDNIRNLYALYDEICAELQKDAGLVQMLRDHITPSCYPDPELRTLTSDVGFYIRFYISSQNDASAGGDIPERKYWLLSANPQIWSFSQLKPGEEVSYTLRNDNGSKRRIFQNFLDAKAGDIVIGYESSPVKQITAICTVSEEQDGENIYFQKIEGLISPVDYQTLKEIPELSNMQFFQNYNGSLFSLTQEEFNCIMDIIREVNPSQHEDNIKPYGKDDFLAEVFMTEEKYNHLVSLLLRKKNIILQGAPGVGKTFTAKRLAYSIMGCEDDSRIEFVQFHQNYTYEDFIMGYRPSGEGFSMQYGIFYKFCKRAANNQDKEYFFIIDEINRGNLSRIFGELLMLIEVNYRDTAITLAYNAIPFSVIYCRHDEYS